MTKRDNHYEAAFEEYLRSRRAPYLAVDETRRSLWAPGSAGSLKSLDFVVTPQGGAKLLLLDVKGRRFPPGTKPQYWKNWSTTDELRSLSRWEKLLGPNARAVLLFAFHLAGDKSPLPVEELFSYRGRTYAYLGVELAHYAAYARRLSPRWDTVTLPVPIFRRLAQPFSLYLAGGSLPAPHEPELDAVAGN